MYAYKQEKIGKAERVREYVCRREGGEGEKVGVLVESACARVCLVCVYSVCVYLVCVQSMRVRVCLCACTCVYAHFKPWKRCISL